MSTTIYTLQLVLGPLEQHNKKSTLTCETNLNPYPSHTYFVRISKKNDNTSQFVCMFRKYFVLSYVWIKDRLIDPRISSNLNFLLSVNGRLLNYFRHFVKLELLKGNKKFSILQKQSLSHIWKTSLNLLKSVFICVYVQMTYFH